MLLFQRGLNVDVRCKRCGTPKSVIHVLRECPFSIKDVVRKSISETLQWQKAQASRAGFRKSPSDKPRIIDIISGFVCNVDEIWNAASLNCGMGWILTFMENSSAFSATASCVDVSSALVAETRALKAALIYAIDLGCYIITVRSDSQTLVQLLNSRDSHIDVDMLLEDIRELAGSFDSIFF